MNKIAILHKSFTQPENSAIVEQIDNESLNSKQRYCDKHGYEFIIDNTPSNIENHWNEDYWAHIPATLNIFKEHNDIEWVFFTSIYTTVNQYNIKLEEFIYDNRFNEKNILLGYMDAYSSHNYIIENDQIIRKHDEHKMRRTFVASHCSFFKNNDITIQLLNKIYNDNRFTQNMFSYENRKKIDYYRGTGSTIPDVAFTTFYNHYDEYTNNIGIFPMYELFSVPKPKNAYEEKQINEWSKNIGTDSNVPHGTKKSFNANSLMTILACNMPPERLLKK